MNVPHDELALAAANWAWAKAFLLAAASLCVAIGLLAAIEDRRRWWRAVMFATLAALIVMFVVNARSCVRITSAPSLVTEGDLP